MARSVALLSVLLAIGVAEGGRGAVWDTVVESAQEEGHRLHRRSAESGVEVDWNAIIDGVFVLAQQQILSQNLDELPIPDVNETFDKKIGFLKVNGRFTASGGFVNSLSSIRRTGDVSFSTEGPSITLTSHLGLAVLRVRYDNYYAEIFGTGPRGRISAAVSSNSVRLRFKLELRDDGCGLLLEEAKVVDLGRFDVSISGLGSLDWLASKIATWVTEKRRGDIISKLESALTKQLTRAVERFDCDKYYNEIRGEVEKYISK